MIITIIFYIFFYSIFQVSVRKLSYSPQPTGTATQSHDNCDNKSSTSYTSGTDTTLIDLASNEHINNNNGIIRVIDDETIAQISYNNDNNKDNEIPLSSSKVLRSSLTEDTTSHSRAASTTQNRIHLMPLALFMFFSLNCMTWMHGRYLCGGRSNIGIGSLICWCSVLLCYCFCCCFKSNWLC